MLRGIPRSTTSAPRAGWSVEQIDEKQWPLARHTGQHLRDYALRSSAPQVADEVCFLHRGRILEWGKPEEILKQPRLAETKDFLKRIHDAGRL